MAIIPERRRWLLQHAVLALIALAALLLRLYYVHTTVVIQPIRGDAVQYYAYAWNLIHHHVFSGALPNATPIVPDSFRDPGYPTFLAMLAGTGEMQQTFIQRVLDAQSVLSAATLWMFAVLTRRWAGFAAACAVGVLLGFWPHTITLAGYVLSETLTGFLVAAALLLLDNMLQKGRSWRAVVAGLAFALAALTNAVLAPFAPLLAAWQCWRDRDRRGLWGILLVAALLPLAAWSLRGAGLPGGQESSGDRARMNLVQGSWPEYHALVGLDDPRADSVMKTIGAEYDTLRASTFGGLVRIGTRLSAEPLRYTGWYLSKPLELWGWNIGVGEGDIYVYPTFRSPPEHEPHAERHHRSTVFPFAIPDAFRGHRCHSGARSTREGFARTTRGSPPRHLGHPGLWCSPVGCPLRHVISRHRDPARGIHGSMGRKRARSPKSDQICQWTYYVIV